MKAKAIGILAVATLALCASSAFAKKAERETVTVLDQQSSTAAYDWYVNGRMSTTCYGNRCTGVFSNPASGTQEVQGSILMLKRSDNSIAIARCESKVNIFSSVVVAVDAFNANDPHAPTVYRDCRTPGPNMTVEAVFHGDSVKLYWEGASETYSIKGYLQPTSQRYLSQPVVAPASFPPPVVAPAYLSQPSVPTPPSPVLASGFTSAGTELQPYRFPSDGFSIAFPAEPEIDPSAKRFKLRTFIAPDSSVGLFVGVGLSPAAASEADSDALLHEAERVALIGMVSHLVSEQRVTLGVFPGIEFEAENSKMHSSVRIYLVGSTLYQMSVVHPAGKPYTEASRFLDSFQIIPRASN